MSYHQDWLLRQIELMIQAILSKICNKQSQTIYDDNYEIQQTLSDLLKNNRICEAENLVFELVNSRKDDYVYFSIVLDFYMNLNSMSEEDLNKCNFSHQEICDGLINFCSYYENDSDIKKLLDAFDLEKFVEEENI